ncbi:hypothetical protein RhiirA4_430071 [Rhizophagus irregularis]|uniref:Crinkler effector protein N-terminal domain-containing protein n=1 Tax=Rhizophagus irregularis TaxID=588596 RepID=A0A2I1HJ75_9GLOM|nr:hypothetical protein RhiirA4_430071 [Rhizophagus irregularis]
MTPKTIQVMEKITLFYSVYGITPVQDTISIEISGNNTIADLCEIVKKRYSGENLTLWKMEDPIAVDGTDGRITILNMPFDPFFNIGGRLGGKKMSEMSSFDKIHTHFSTKLDKKYIHIIVQYPDERKEIQCFVTYGKTEAAFRWIIVSQEELMLDLLKGKIRDLIPSLKNIKKEYISIFYSNGCDKKILASTFKISDDKDLIKVAWTSHYLTSLELIAKIPQQPFSNWSFQLLRNAFKLNASSWDSLEKFQGKRCDVSQYQQSIDNVVGELLRRKVTSPYIPTASEATRREFISCVLHGVAYCFNGEIKVVPEYGVAGSFGRGPVDWAVLMGDKIIAIIEAKKDDIEQGISQNTVQLHSAIEGNLRLRSSGEHTSTKLYGIVTNALEWFIIKVTDCTEKPIDVKLSNLTPINLPLTGEKLSEDKLLEPVKDLFSQILWIFNDQISNNNGLPSLISTMT